MQLHEQVRPSVWADVVGQDEIIAQIMAIKSRSGIAGRAWWIQGKSGTGKTTIAKLIAAEIADLFFTQELDAETLTVSDLARIDGEMRLYGCGAGGKNGRAFIINEAHGLRKPVIRKLLTMLEPLPSHVVFIFTTTTDGLTMFEDCQIDAAPLLSRCEVLALNQRNLAKPFAERAQKIARQFGLDGQPIEKYVRLVNDKGANLRAVLQAIEAGKMKV